MKSTTAQRFGSLGKSFGAPSAAAAVIGAALLASDTSDTSETAWSPAAACLLPDVLPISGTLLSYGGNRQLAAGGTVTHSGALSVGSLNIDDGSAFGILNLTTTAGRTGQIKHNGALVAQLTAYSSDVTFYKPVTIGANAFTCGAITASGGTFGSGGNYIDLNITGGAGSLYQSSTASVANYTNCATGYYVDWVHRSGGVGKTNIRTVAGGIGCFIVSTDTGGGFAERFGVDNANIRANLQTVFDNSGDYPIKLSRGGTASAYLGANSTRDFIVYDSAGHPALTILTTSSSASKAATFAGSITSSGAIQETPTQSALDPTTANIPSGKRQGWYNTALSEFRDWVNIGGTLLKSAAYT